MSEKNKNKKQEETIESQKVNINILIQEAKSEIADVLNRNLSMGVPTSVLSLILENLNNQIQILALKNKEGV